MDHLIAWLPRHIPQDDETTIAHGDFRLENLIFHPTEPRILAVIDWELSTLGSPLSDLAYNCIPYYVADPTRGDITDLDSVTSGIPTEEEQVARYAAQSGRKEISDWKFHMVLSLFRLAAISQGVYKRGLEGNAASPEAILRRDRCRVLAETAWALVEKGVLRSTHIRSVREQSFLLMLTMDYFLLGKDLRGTHQRIHRPLFTPRYAFTNRYPNLWHVDVRHPLHHHLL